MPHSKSKKVALFRKKALAVQLSGLFACLLVLGTLVSASIFQQEKHRVKDHLLTYLIEKSHTVLTLMTAPDGEILSVDERMVSNLKVLDSEIGGLERLGKSAHVWLVQTNEESVNILITEEKKKEESLPGGTLDGFASLIKEAINAPVHSVSSDGETTVVYHEIGKTPYGLVLTIDNKEVYQEAITTVFLVCVSLAIIGLFFGLLIYFFFLRIYSQVDLYIGQLEIDLEKKQDELREELKSHEFVVNNATDYLARFSGEGKLLFASEGVERVIGYNKQDVYGIKHSDLIHHDDKVRVFEHVKQVIKSRGQGSIEFRLRHKDGSLIWVEGACRAVSSVPGEADESQTVWIIRDIQDRHCAEERLKESEERLREIAENVNGVFWLREKDKVLYISPKVEEILGVSVKEFIENPFKVLDYIHPEDRDELKMMLEASVTGEKLLDVEVRLCLPDKGVRWVHARVFPAGDPRKNRFAGFAEDITERKQVQNDLEESRQRHREAQKVARLGHWELDLVSKNLHWSDEAYRLFGVEPQSQVMTDETFYALVHPDDRQKVIDVFLNSLETKNPYKINHRVVLPEGKERYLQEQCQTVYNDKGEAIRSFGTVLDITDLAKAEQQLRSQSEFLEKLIENMPVGLWVKDGRQDFRYVFWNAFMEKMTGISSRQIIGKNDLEINMSKDAQLYMEEDFDLLTHPRRLEIPLRSFFGRQVNILKIPIADDEGIPSSVLGLLTDVTDRVEAEVRLRHAQKMEAVGQIAGGLAHDFNNILQVIQGGCFLLETTSPLAGEDNEELKSISSAVGSGMALTRQLLSFSRNEEIDLTPTSLNSLVVNMATMLRRVLGENILFHFEVDHEAGLIEGDPAQIEQVLMNLCVNARDAMPEGGELTLRTQREYVEAPPQGDGDFSPGFYLVLSVRDTGTGIDKDSLENIFDPFYTTKENGKGTGLGLSTVYTIMKKHRGWIDVSSKEEAGTIFEIYFPEYIEEEDIIDLAIDSVNETQGGTEKILFVEDHKVIARTMSRMLEGFGYEVVVALSAEEALELYEEMEKKPDVLISDVLLPKENGLELYHALREKQSSLPVIFCSGYTKERLLDEYQVELPETLLKKPYHHGLLLQAIRNVLDEVHS
jgi:PAS domain S-box-containing protein